MSLATQFDLTREEIIDSYRQRIQREQRTKLTRDERENLALLFLDRLKQANTESEIKSLCEREISLLEEGYPQQTISSDILSLYRKVIRDAITVGDLPLTATNSHIIQWTKRNSGQSGVTQEHFALTHLKYDQEIYRRLRSQTTIANNERQDDLKPVALDEYLLTATELLKSNDDRDLAIGIAALTGRRHTEVASLGQFELTNYPYLLHFQGQQKKQGEFPSYDILTLLPAKEILAAIERFRGLPQIQAIAGASYQDPGIATLNTRINRRVRKHFEETGIVPVLKLFKTVSIHRLRGVYGAIAVHYFCPQGQHEHRFLQHYLGHILDEQREQPNSTATTHYFHYYLVNEQGNPIGARGIKVMANGMPPTPKTLEAPVSEAPASPPEQSTSSKPKKRNRSTLGIYRDQRDRWLSLLDSLFPKGSSQLEQMDALINWIEMQLDSSDSQAAADSPTPPDQQELQPNTPEFSPEVYQTVSNQAKTLAWLTRWAEDLEKEATSLRQERDALQEEITQLSQSSTEDQALREQNARLEAELRQAQSKLETFRRLLNGGGRPAVPSPPSPTNFAHPLETADVSSTPTEKSSPTPQRGRGSSRAKDRAREIFTAIEQWNQAHPEETFAITTGLLEKTFGINRKAANEFAAEYAEAIAQHHAAIRVQNERSHNRGKNIELIKSFVEQQGSSSLENKALTPAPVAPSSASSSTNLTPPKKEDLAMATATEANQEITTGQSSASAEARVNFAIDEIIKHNSQPDLPREEKWAITQTVLKSATNSYQGVVKRVLESRKDEIEAHHQMYGLGKYHNNIHRGKDLSIVDIVNLQQADTTIGDQLRQQASELKERQGKVLVVDVAQLALKYGLPLKTTFRMLEGEILPSGTYDRLVDRGLQVNEVFETAKRLLREAESQEKKRGDPAFAEI